MPVLIENIVLKSRKPNFDRDAVDLIEDLLNAKQSHYDQGHIVYCRENGKHYKFLGSDGEFGVEKDEIIGYFRPIDEELKKLINSSQTQVHNLIEETKANLKDDLSKTDALLVESVNRIDELATKLDEIYLKENPCKASIRLTTNGSSVPSANEKGKKLNITIHISVSRGGNELDRAQVKTITLYTTQSTTLSNELIKTTKTYNAGEVGVNTTYKIKFELTTGETCEASASVNFYPMSYFGVFSGELDPSTLTPVLLSSKSYTATVNQNNERNCFMYPINFGSLSSIKDSFGYELINSYIKTTMEWNNEAYYVYTLTRASTVENYKLIFK